MFGQLIFEQQQHLERKIGEVGTSLRLMLCFLGAGCEPRSFWFLARHGTRNPGKKDMVKQINLKLLD